MIMRMQQQNCALAAKESQILVAFPHTAHYFGQESAQDMLLSRLAESVSLELDATLEDSTRTEAIGQ